MLVGNQFLPGRPVLSMISVVVNPVALGTVFADHFPYRSIRAFDLRPRHASELSRGRSRQPEQRNRCADRNLRGSPTNHRESGLVLEPNESISPTCRPLASYFGNFSMPYLCNTASSIFEVRSVLSGKTMCRLPLNLPSMPPSRMTGTFTCAWRCELPI